MPEIVPTEGEPAIPSARAGSYPVRDGNLVLPLVDGEPAFRRICEAMEAARHSIWATIAYAWPNFVMPDGRGSIFDVLDRAVARGVEVRLIFWRQDEGARQVSPNLFWGSPKQRRMLAARASQIRIRWDRAAKGFAQHQKTWLVDAGREGEAGFVGGINLNPHSMTSPGHAGGGDQNHDVYAELAGPSATDLAHNFVQRWNEASEREAEDGIWGEADDMAFPMTVSAPRGTSRVQIQRTIRRGLYSDGRATPGGEAFDIAAGERSVLEQYLAAIGAARRAIYLENQFIEVIEIVEALAGALARGVEVVALVPADPDAMVTLGARWPERQGFVAARGALGGFPNFTFAGIAGRGPDGARRNVYVHAKLMLVDDDWATVGSANLHGFSLFGSNELNASVWDPAFAKALRCELLAEHLGRDTSHLDLREALALYAKIARENAARHAVGDPNWQGLAHALEPSTYGV
jgi:cardiolipin synthase